MTEQKPGFFAQLKSYPATFWVANTMEIFERMAWYGWFTVMALYVTGTVETGGLGFSTETRGNLQAIVPFFLYLMPVLTGALADRYGYKKMFTLSYLTMIVSYYLLGQFHTLPTFFMAFMFVAVGAAMFKPVVVGTVARVTNESNSAMGFGVFYMMVNVGGFLGPIVAGVVRGEGWEWVFVACSVWAAVNLVLVLVFYKEPTTESTSEHKRSLSTVLDNTVEVLGNLRFFITVFTILFALMIASLGFDWFTWMHCLVFVPAWLVANFFYDATLPAGSGRPNKGDGPRRFPLFKRMHCSNWRFALFLLIMSGFWTSFNQIFYTMPEYIRDFTNTRPLIKLAESVFGDSDQTDPAVGIGAKIATISDLERVELANLAEELLAAFKSGTLSQEALEEASHDLLPSKVRLEPDALKALVTSSDLTPEATFSSVLNRLIAQHAANQQAEGLSKKEIDPAIWRAASDELRAAGIHFQPATLKAMAGSAKTPTGALITNQFIIQGRQVNPEFIVNVDALSIVLLQVFVSFMMARFHRFTTMIVGMLVAAVGIGLSALAADTGMLGTGGLVWIVVAGLFVFAVGEMMASPTSQEYVGRIAPRDKVALYMGYYFVSIALGNLFGGILSGQLYGKLARDMQRPDLMWMAFGGIMLFTAIMFILYNKFVLPREAADQLTPDTTAS